MKLLYTVKEVFSSDEYLKEQEKDHYNIPLWDFSKKCVNSFSLNFAVQFPKTVGRRALYCKATKL